MPWSAPATAIANTFLTAAFWNTEVRDHLLETAPAKAVAAGDTFYATGANAIARLAAAASNGSLYQQAAGIPAWLAPAGALRAPRMNATNNLLEYVSGINLAQPPLFATGSVTPTGALTDCVTQAITTSGGRVIIIASGTGGTTSTAATPITFQHAIARDATTLRIKQTQIPNPTAAAGNSYMIQASFIWMETPAAGSYTYKLQVSATATPFACPGELIVIELAP